MKLATTAYFCHEEKLAKNIVEQVNYFLTPKELQECQAVGSLFGLAQILDPGALGTLDQFRFVRNNKGALTLEGPRAFMAMKSEEVAKKLNFAKKNLNALTA